MGLFTFKKSKQKAILAKGVSVWNRDGTPLFLHVPNGDVEAKELEGGLFSTIAAFARSHMNCSNIQLKGPEGTHIVIRSFNFIGSILWTPELAVPIEESEKALQDLLNYVESLYSSIKTSDIPTQLSAYCSNFM